MKTVWFKVVDFDIIHKIRCGAQGETRTLTPVKAGDFESPASTIPPLGPHEVD